MHHRIASLLIVLLVANFWSGPSAAQIAVPAIKLPDINKIDIPDIPKIPEISPQEAGRDPSTTIPGNQDPRCALLTKQQRLETPGCR